MLISITESCRMGCSHCMDDAKPCDRHMTLQTFKDAIQKAFNVYGGFECVITGGEPTENPQWLEMFIYALEYAKGSIFKGAHITLTTNAMNIADNHDLQTYLMMLMQKYRNIFTIQVTHVDKYYPINVNLDNNFFKLEQVVVCHEIEAMYPMGRARVNNLPWNFKGSKCFNIRSLVRSTKDLRASTLALATKMKFCTPQIDIYGNIKLGESNLCPVASNIYKTEKEIVNDICNFTCRGCDMINMNLPESYLEAIGEKVVKDICYT